MIVEMMYSLLSAENVFMNRHGPGGAQMGYLYCATYTTYYILPYAILKHKETKSYTLCFVNKIEYHVRYRLFLCLHEFLNLHNMCTNKPFTKFLFCQLLVLSYYV